MSFGKISRKYAIPETFTRLLISRYENCTRIIRITTRDALPTLWTDLIIDRSFRYSFPLSLSLSPYFHENNLFNGESSKLNLFRRKISVTLLSNATRIQGWQIRDLELAINAVTGV